MAQRFRRKQRTLVGRTQETPGAQRGDVVPLAAANHRILRNLQSKLEIGDASDLLEQEADRVAQSVMRMPAERVFSASSGSVQRKCSCVGSEKCDKCRDEDLLQRRAATSVTPAAAPPSVV